MIWLPKNTGDVVVERLKMVLKGMKKMTWMIEWCNKNEETLRERVVSKK